MPRRRSKVNQIAVDYFAEGLGSQPIKNVVGKRDLRSLGKEQRILGELSEFRASDVAKELGISTQKYVAFRRQIKAGKVSNPVISAYLERAREALAETPKLVTAEYTAHIPHVGNRRVKETFWSVPEKWINRNASWSQNIKGGGFASQQSALNWWGQVGGANEYFVIVVKRQKGRPPRYYIYDIRTPSERKGKGNLKGELKFNRVMKETGHGNKKATIGKGR